MLIDTEKPNYKLQITNYKLKKPIINCQLHIEKSAINYQLKENCAIIKDEEGVWQNTTADIKTRFSSTFLQKTKSEGKFLIAV